MMCQKKIVVFNSDYNRVLIIDGNENLKVIKRNKKSFIANKIAKVF